MLVRLEDYLRICVSSGRLSQADSDEFERRLELIADVSVRSQAIRNVYDERSMDQDEWWIVLSAIMAAPRNPSELRSAFTLAMRGLQLHGPTAKCPTGTNYGRATKRDPLARAL